MVARNGIPHRIWALIAAGAVVAAGLVLWLPEGQARAPQTCFGKTATIAQQGNISGTGGDDVIVGLGGDNKIAGNGGNDIICGGPGNERSTATRATTSSSATPTRARPARATTPSPGGRATTF